MYRKKSLIIIGIVAVVIVASIAVVLRRVPSETELPNQTILANQKDVKEVKAFLNKYPNSGIVDRSGPGGLHVDYTANNLSQFNATIWDTATESGRRIIIDNNGNKVGDYRYIGLRVYADNAGKPKPQEMEVHCFDGKDTTIIREDIMNYIETETCLES